jgi:hypothetical protein
MDLSTYGKWIVAISLSLAAIGAVLWLVGKSGIPFGSLPGDIRVERPGFSFSFPLVTCIVLSAALTLILNVVVRFFRK